MKFDNTSKNLPYFWKISYVMLLISEIETWLYSTIEKNARWIQSHWARGKCRSAKLNLSLTCTFVSTRKIFIARKVQHKKFFLLEIMRWKNQAVLWKKTQFILCVKQNRGQRPKKKRHSKFSKNFPSADPEPILVEMAFF